jgi:hypothetical protein
MDYVMLDRIGLVEVIVNTKRNADPPAAKDDNCRL